MITVPGRNQSRPGGWSGARRKKSGDGDGEAEDDPHSDPFPQCPVGQNELATTTSISTACPGLLPLGRFSSFVFYIPSLSTTYRYRTGTLPPLRTDAINIDTTDVQHYLYDVSIRIT